MRLLGYLARLGTVALVVALSLALATTTLAAGRPLFATMTGAQVFPGPGDPDGTGTVKLRLNQGLGRICYRINVQNVTVPASSADIHFGAVGGAGPVVVTLGAPDASGAAVGCVTDVAHWLIRTIRRHPRLFYVDVHTTDFVDGAVRGQLHWHAKPQ
jgi:hypothetical protein